MHRDRTANNDFVANGCACRMDVYFLRHDADARSVDENFVCFAAIDHLRIASDQLHTGGIGSIAHRLDDAPEIFHRKTFLQDKAGREIKRARSTHREIVYRPVNGEFSDIASGKKDRTDHERIGAERDAFAVQRKNCAVVEWLEQVVAKLRQYHLFDQLVTQFSATAVREDNLLVIGDRQRTGSAEKRG